MSSPIVIAGDPHGNFAPILCACGAQEPGTLILLGDCELRVPLRHMLASLFTMGWHVHWILGNKDTETNTVFDNLAGDFPAGDIGGTVIEVGGLRIAGLGGVFKPRIWYPRADQGHGRIEPPQFNTRGEFLAKSRRARALARRAAAMASRFDLSGGFRETGTASVRCAGFA